MEKLVFRHLSVTVTFSTHMYRERQLGDPWFAVPLVLLDRTWSRVRIAHGFPRRDC